LSISTPQIIKVEAVLKLHSFFSVEIDVIDRSISGCSRFTHGQDLRYSLNGKVVWPSEPAWVGVEERNYLAHAKV